MTKQLRDDELNRVSGAGDGVDISPVPGHGGKPILDPSPTYPKPTPGGQDEVEGDGQGSGSGGTDLGQLP